MSMLGSTKAARSPEVCDGELRPALAQFRVALLLRHPGQGSQPLRNQTRIYASCPGLFPSSD